MRALRRAAAREARHRQIKATPEEVRRTDLAEVTRAELLEHAIDRQQHAPEALRLVRINSLMRTILVERNGARDLIRRAVNLNLEIELGERRPHPGVKNSLRTAPVTGTARYRHSRGSAARDR